VNRKVLVMALSLISIVVLTVMSGSVAAANVEESIGHHGTISGNITYTPKIYISTGYEWRMVNFVNSHALSFAQFFYFYQPILVLQINGKTVTIVSQTLVTYRGVQAYQVEIKPLRGILKNGLNYFEVKFNPAYDNLLTHTGRGENIDVNGDGSVYVYYSTDGVIYDQDSGVELIYEIVGTSIL
jgi:hypothetical protein